METKEIITEDGRLLFENMQDLTGLRWKGDEEWQVPPDLEESAKQACHDNYAYMRNPAGKPVPFLLSCLHENETGITLKISPVQIYGQEDMLQPPCRVF